MITQEKSHRVTVTWESKTTGELFFVEIDATHSEEHPTKNTVTDHPVETGANIADHIRPDPDHVTIEGVISNTPIHIPADHANGAKDQLKRVRASWYTADSRGTATGAPKTLGDIPLPIPHLLGAIPIGGGDVAQIGRAATHGEATANVHAFHVPFDRVGACDQAFLKISKDGTLCSVITALRTYSDMAIETYTVARSAEDGDVLSFSIGFKQVSFGETEQVAVPALPTKRVSKGSVSGTDPESDPPESMSVLRGAVTGH